MTVKGLEQNKYKQLTSAINDVNGEHINNSVVYKRSHQTSCNRALAEADTVTHSYLLRSRVQAVRTFKVSLYLIEQSPLSS